MTMLRPASARNVVLGSLALLIALAAVLYYMRYGGGTDQPPTDPSSWVYFKCEACGARFHLNGQELDQAQRQLGGGGPKIGNVPMFVCKQCGARKATRDRNQAP
jgi:hypothetical protein